MRFFSTFYLKNHDNIFITLKCIKYIISTKILVSTTVVIIDNNKLYYVSWAANKHIQMISDETEDWSNDAENSALITAIHFKIYSNRKQLV